MYQYGDEVLQFGGGRLLLRGTNGAGKTMAMNMLLPFLLVAQLRGLDAAGEQSGTQVLRSWMLDGKERRQPGGYLWLEFRRGNDFFTCGCGLKASKSTGTVNHWWFAVDQRPILDFPLQKDSVPLSEGQLRSLLEGGQVFSERQRPDYRRLINKRLFGGVSTEQHFRLLNRVRNPRVGDRIDIEIPQLLKDALPQLRDRILDTVARSLDDLEERRREVVGLEQTSEALEGVLDVYRSYCFSWIGDARDRGMSHIKEVARIAREQDRRQREVEGAIREVEKLELSIADLDSSILNLSSTIEALMSSHAYRGIQELDTRRQLVANHRRRVGDAEIRVESAEDRVQGDASTLKDRETDARQDLNRVNHGIDGIATIGQRHGVDGDPPSRILLPNAGAELAAGRISEGIDRFDTGIQARKRGVSEVRAELERVRKLEAEMCDIEQMLQDRKAQAEEAWQHARGRAEELEVAALEWVEHSRSWSSQVVAVLGDASPWSTEPAKGASSISTLEEVDAERKMLAGAINDSITTLRKELSLLERELSDIRRSKREAQALADKWANLTEPELPHPAWQSSSDYCLADLIDFSPSLSPAEQAGVEAALEASGLLFARPDAHSVILANGELVAIPSTPSPRPLSQLLSVRISARLRDAVKVDDLENLLGSLSTDPSDTGAAAIISADGTFQVGSLRGRHFKEYPEFIGETTRQRTLERERMDANARLRDIEAEFAKSRGLSDSHKDMVRRLEGIRQDLPVNTEVAEASARLGEAEVGAETKENRLSEQSERMEQSRRVTGAARDRLRATAQGLSLPDDPKGLDQVWGDLELANEHLREVRQLLERLERSVAIRNDAVGRKADSERDMGDAHDALAQHQEDLRSQEGQLSTLEESIGVDAREIADRHRRHQDDLEAKKLKMRQTRKALTDAFRRRADAKAGASAASVERGRLDEQGENLARTLSEALSTPGLWKSLTEDAYPAEQMAPPMGIQRVLATLDEYLPAHSGERVGAGGVSMSVMRRRDRLGGGWDVETRSPDDANLPLLVEVNGPSGRTTLARAVTTVRREYEMASSALGTGQEAQLRDLLQGAIAKEVAERSHAAKELVAKMRRHIQELSTGSQIGVDIRWHIDPSLDADTKRMVELMSMLPDTRTDADHKHLTLLLNQHLERSRVEYPEIGYKQALSEALDYRNWHRLQVKVRRENEPYKVLGRKNDLSEGEKKFVTYLPLFAAVAASCDSISETSEEYGISRFILLDDAFAKVSEDNHAQLFGLLTDLDLDWIATSERLWGNHATIPELEIVEVVRDPDLRTILLEKNRWNGRSIGVPYYD